jgi:NADPH:quinone reductase-like Zn-dependent oxidoreductase
MQKIAIHSAGSYEKLKLETHPDLIPSAEEVIVETLYCGVNYADCCVRWGVYESAKKYIGWPITPGFEFSGVVKKVGSKVTRWKNGDKVFGITFFNGYASEIKVHEKFLYSIPESFTPEEAAGFPAVFMTAYHALFQLVRLPEKASILVHSAGGGVGSAILQLARAHGIMAVAVVGSSHKVDYVKSLGANHVIDKSQEPLWEKAREYCPQGYDAVLDANGPSTLNESYEILRPTGKLIAYGSHSILPQSGSGRMNYLKAAWGLVKMPRFNPMKLITENKSVIGFNLSFLFDRDDLVGEGMSSLLKLIEEGKILPPKVTIFESKNVADSHRLIESGKSTGKIVLSWK